MSGQSIQRRAKEDNYYLGLQKSSLDMLQYLSGDIWTDFNIHDPGLTISDFLNYALYELHYTYSFPFESYLSDRDGVVRYDEKGIFDTDTVFAPSIVTENDYEFLVMSTFEQVQSCYVKLESGHYYISIKPKKELSAGEREELRIAVLKLYHRNRNLCENVHSVKVVKELGNHGGKAYSGMPEYGKTERRVKFQKVPLEYRSIQLDFPENYGLGERGIPDSSSDTYKAQVMQLKAYMLIFDHMLADASDQAAVSNELFELSGKIPVSKTPDVTIPQIEKLIEAGIKHAASRGRNENWLHTQKSRYLDLLDNLYGERTDPFFRKQSDEAIRNGLRANLIRLFPELNANRFQSFDIYDPLSMPVIKQLSGAINGESTKDEIPALKSLEEYNLRLISDEEFFAQYNDYLSLSAISGIFYTPLFSDKFEPVKQIRILYEKKDFEELKSKIILLSRNAISESFLLYGAMPQHYKMVHLTETDVYLLLFQYPGKKEWMKLGVFRNSEELIGIANLLWGFLLQFDPQRQSFYMVEHNLLNTGDKYVSPEDQYALSIVYHGSRNDEGKRLRLEEFLQERLPAHLTVTMFRVELDRLFSFEEIYFGWREALAAGNDRVAYFSKSIRAFLDLSEEFSKNLYE